MGKIEKMYLIRQNRGDKLWLLDYKPSGCKEYLGDGKFMEFYACIWGNHWQDARQFATKATAQVTAKIIGGCSVVPIGKEGVL